ncbi:MAG TPA: 1-deoxy-D-xylulose-5-phosphate reductoisomerase [candidate division WOR-3 bacterium]|uniref:1-deoxy-D-xylulose 5-phosphate reductoisomerase n=1 Tax=candidate division WOR-3 bacterium TaxID=2052148 RepID=A0A7V0T4B7_UNCW3|nr:1-deoxy-D-xylulose-5-phosphate reductoisomerase [candidate division WOR-3 bacterium]
MRRRRVAVYGSTGSIGRATLDVIRRMPDRFEVAALACRASARAVAAQARRFGVTRVVLTDGAACRRARRLLEPACKVGWGLDGLLDIAADRRTEIHVMAMAGTIGVLPSVAALERGRRLAIATKEILVGFGGPVMRLAAHHGTEVIPVDSELSAVHQCLRSGRAREVRRVVLTASGGPFRRAAPRANATVQTVLRHPTWRMGRKITVDSATMMNKGLEIIETARLFGLEPRQVEAVIHPQSLVHSLVEFNDGSMLAQLARPDMRLPIQYALTWPDRLASPVGPLDLAAPGRLDFESISPGRFPCYALARRALETGPAATCALNAANEVAVEAFLAGRLRFGRIAEAVAAVLDNCRAGRTRNPGIATLLNLERKTRALAREVTQKMQTGET